MRRLLPTATPVDLGNVYGGLELPDMPWLALGMVTSVDGAIAVEGRSRALGADGDLAGFRAMRALADIVLVGARTVVAERYSASWPVRHAEARAARGQQPLPTLAIVSASGELAPDAPVFHGRRTPVLVTTERGASVAAAAGLGVELLVVSEASGGVDLGAALTSLRAAHGPRIVSEGGPSLNASLLDGGHVDELFVTIAPQLVGSSGPGLAGALADGIQLTLHEVRVHGSELLCRYQVRPSGYGPDADRRG